MGRGDTELAGQCAGGAVFAEPEVAEAVEAVGVAGELDGFGCGNGEQSFQGVEPLPPRDPRPPTGKLQARPGAGAPQLAG